MGLEFRTLGQHFTKALQKTYDTIGESCSFTYNMMFANQNVARAREIYDKALEGVKYVPNDPSPPETFDPSSEDGKAFIQTAENRLNTALEIVAESSAKWNKVYDYFSANPEGLNDQRPDDDDAAPS